MIKGRLLFTSFAHFEANVATRSADRRSHGKGTLYTILLFTSFAHFEANVATRSADRRSHGKGTFIKILLFTSFAHFEANVATRSADRRSHGKGTLLTRYFCSPLLLTSKQTLRLGQLIEDHMAKEHS